MFDVARGGVGTGKAGGATPPRGNKIQGVGGAKKSGMWPVESSHLGIMHAGTGA